MKLILHWPNFQNSKEKYHGVVIQQKSVTVIKNAMAERDKWERERDRQTDRLTDRLILDFVYVDIVFSRCLITTNI